jgi:hypothetical protein
VSYVNDPVRCDTSDNPLPTNASGVQAAGTPCNKIPSSLIVPQMVLYSKILFPAPVTTGNAAYNGVDNTPGTTNSNQMSIRIDEQIGNNDRVFVRYTGAWQSDVSSNGFQGTTVANDDTSYNLGVAWTHSLDVSQNVYTQVSV